MSHVILCLVLLTVLPFVFAADDEEFSFFNQLMMCKLYNSASPLSLPSKWVVVVLSLGVLAMAQLASDLQRTDILQ